MAGGTFDINVGKTRPGVYTNTKSNKKPKITAGVRGVVLLPLFAPGWGPDGEAVSISVASPDGAMSKLGRSVYTTGDSVAVLVREAFKNAVTVVAYFVNKGTKAKKTVSDGPTFTAIYGGTKGNSINVSCVANPSSGFDVSIFYGGTEVAVYEEVGTVEELIEAAKDNGYVTITGTGDLAAFASVALVDGTDGTVTNSDVTTFLDASEALRWNTMAFPIDAAMVADSQTVSSLCMAVKTKIKYLRENTDRVVNAIVPGYAGDYEGIINVTNSVELETGEKLTTAQACAWVAGATAAAGNTTSLTYTVYDGATSIIGAKTNEEAIASLKAGEFFFSYHDDSEGNQVIGVEQDINSLTTFTADKTKDYSKNRVLRVYDQFRELLQRTFIPSKFDGNNDGYDIIEGIGRTQCLGSFEAAGAIKNVDPEADFIIDRELSSGDSIYYHIGLEAVDSAEKHYFDIGTR